jgi:hypothetical protein
VNIASDFPALQSCVLFTENASAETRQDIPYPSLFCRNDVSDCYRAHQRIGGGIRRFWNHTPGDFYRLTGHFCELLRVSR